MLHPDYPIMEGKYRMTADWSVTLNQPHNRRIEDGSLVIWRPGFTVWVNVWGNDNNQTIEERVKRIQSDVSPSAYEIISKKNGSGFIHAYRL